MRRYDRDPLGPARGIGLAVVLGTLLWGAVFAGMLVIFGCAHAHPHSLAGQLAADAAKELSR